MHPPNNSTIQQTSPNFWCKKKRCSSFDSCIYLWLSPLQVTLTTMIIRCLVSGDPKPNLEFAAINSACISQPATGCFPPMIWTYTSEILTWITQTTIFQKALAFKKPIILWYFEYPILQISKGETPNINSQNCHIWKEIHVQNYSKPSFIAIYLRFREFIHPFQSSSLPNPPMSFLLSRPAPQLRRPALELHIGTGTGAGETAWILRQQLLKLP